MSFGEEIFRALTGRDHEPASFSDMVQEVTQYRHEIGLSRRAFAKQSGIPETTLRRWEAGVNPRAQEARRPQLVNAYRGLISSPAAVARWRSNGMTIRVDGVPVRGGSARTHSLDLTAGKLKLAAGTGDRVVDAFLRGDDPGAARAFMRGIGDPWYRNVMFGSWLASHDEDLSDLAYEDQYDGDDDYAVTASAH